MKNFTMPRALLLNKFCIDSESDSTCTLSAKVYFSRQMFVKLNFEPECDTGMLAQDIDGRLTMGASRQWGNLLKEMRVAISLWIIFGVMGAKFIILIA